MNQTLQAPRLDRLRQGLDLAVERLYIQKARKGLPVVVAAPSGDPCRISAEKAIDRLADARHRHSCRTPDRN